MTASAMVPSPCVADPLAGIEVMIVDDQPERPLSRCLASLERQVRRAGRVTVQPRGAEPDPALLSRSGAPWVLVLCAGDRLHPGALFELERRTDAAREPLLPVRLTPGGAVPPPGGLGAAQAPETWRLLVRRDWSRWPELVAEIAATGLQPVVGRMRSDWSPSEGPQGLVIAEELLAPLGELSTPPLDVDRMAAVLGGQPHDLTLVALGGLDPRWPATLPFIPTLVANDWTDLPRVARAVRTGWLCVVHPVLGPRVDRSFLTRLQLLRHAGAAAVVLTPLGDEPWPDWQRLDPTVGTAIDVVALACVPGHVHAARDARGDVGTAGTADVLVQRIVQQAWAASPRGVVCNAVRVADGGDGSAPDGPLSMPFARLGFDTIRDGSGRAASPVTAATEGGPTWAPRHVIPLELVVDPARPELVGLATDIAPIRTGRPFARVTIGGIDRYPFPGSRALLRWTVADGAPTGATFDHGSTAAAAAAGAVDAAVLGYAPEIPLVDMSSLHRRWMIGARALQRSLGVALPPWPPRGVEGYAVNRLPSVLQDQDPPMEGPTIIVEAPGGPLLARHPDALPAARRLGLVARPGPALAVEPRPSSVELVLVGGRRGFARAHPEPGDVPLVDPRNGTSWATAPRLRRVPLVEWRSEGQQRLTTGELPLVRRNGAVEPDRRAELVGTLGWLAPPGSGEQPLYELFHPGRGLWAYSSEPGAEAPHGYVIAGVVAETIKIRSMRGVGLRRWYDRRRGQLRVGFKAPSGSIALYGWLDLSDLEACGPAPTIDEAAPLTPGPKPGGWPVVVVHAAGSDTVTADPEPLLRAGGAVTDVLGFVASPVDEVRQLEEATVEAAAVLGSGGAIDLRRLALRLRRELGDRIAGERFA